jgi:hypothetical protein
MGGGGEADSGEAGLRPVIFDEPALAETQDAAAHHEAQRDGLGLHFIAEMLRTRDLI